MINTFKKSNYHRLLSIDEMHRSCTAAVRLNAILLLCLNPPQYLVLLVFLPLLLLCSLCLGWGREWYQCLIYAFIHCTLSELWLAVCLYYPVYGKMKLLWGMRAKLIYRNNAKHLEQCFSTCSPQPLLISKKDLLSVGTVDIWAWVGLYSEAWKWHWTTLSISGMLPLIG